MPKENPLDEAFQEFFQILSFLDKNKDRIQDKAVTLEMEKTIAEMEKNVNSFVKETEAMIEGFGGKQQSLERALEELPAIPSDQKEALKRAHQIKEKITKMREEFGAKPEGDVKHEDPGAGKGKEEKKLSKSEHKKKYRKLGGSKKWKPM